MATSMPRAARCPCTAPPPPPNPLQPDPPNPLDPLACYLRDDAPWAAAGIGVDVSLLHLSDGRSSHLARVRHASVPPSVELLHGARAAGAPNALKWFCLATEDQPEQPQQQRPQPQQAQQQAQQPPPPQHGSPAAGGAAPALERCAGLAGVMRAGGCAPDGSECLLNITITGADGRRISERLQPLTAPGNLALSPATT